MTYESPSDHFDFFTIFSLELSLYAVDFGSFVSVGIPSLIIEQRACDEKMNGKKEEDEKYRHSR